MFLIVPLLPRDQESQYSESGAEIEPSGNQRTGREQFLSGETDNRSNDCCCCCCCCCNEFHFKKQGTLGLSGPNHLADRPALPGFSAGPNDSSSTATTTNCLKIRPKSLLLSFFPPFEPIRTTREIWKIIKKRKKNHQSGITARRLKECSEFQRASRVGSCSTIEASGIRLATLGRVRE